jgi:hypothetical protein
MGRGKRLGSLMVCAGEYIGVTGPSFRTQQCTTKDTGDVDVRLDVPRTGVCPDNW